MHCILQKQEKSCPTEILEAIASINAEGQTDLETNAYAADLSDEWFYYQRWKRQSSDKCLYCWWTGRCWNGYFQQRFMSAVVIIR